MEPFILCPMLLGLHIEHALSDDNSIKFSCTMLRESLELWRYVYLKYFLRLFRYTVFSGSIYFPSSFIDSPKYFVVNLRTLVFHNLYKWTEIGCGILILLTYSPLILHIPIPDKS